MCLDVCIRSLNDLVVTLKYQQYRYLESKESADAAVASIIDQLESTKETFRTIEGRHRYSTDPCPVCDIYKHHNHVKTEWRSVDDAHRDYDNNLLILGDDIDDKTMKEVFLELKSRFNLTVTPIKLSSQNKSGIPLVQQELHETQGAETVMNNAQRFVDKLPVWGLIIDSQKKVLYTNSLATLRGIRPGEFCYTGLSGDGDVCSWCAASDCSDTLSCSYAVNSESSHTSQRDIHWISIDENTMIHFAGVSNLNDYLKESILKSWKRYLSEPIPVQFCETILYSQP